MDTLDVRILGERSDILQVTLNRPEALNAMNTRMLEELRELFLTQAENRQLRAAIIAGAGTRAFSTGGDLKERQNMSEAQWARQHRIAEQGLLAVREFPVPIIAAVEGYAFAGGCELACMCDFIVAAESAVFALVEVTRGIIPGGAGLQNLARAVGTRRAKELIFTAHKFSAQEALTWGFANHVVPNGDAVAVALSIAQDIAHNAPRAVQLAKKAIQTSVEADFRTGYTVELAFYNQLIATEDRREGIRAFMEKRAPVWTD
ncbi:MAG: enoyl-CoA hydratase [Sulfobacillus acidophilus]|uniref:short-chain-enoyl-CoA hydratase n=1 Tax=Sulfobacillus acidophilus TaxID=53633 RepID=A0A2T2WND4_9FIRM|nr:MAG: enoyl-CoA hydratase [Sulfobacillus acidophilus]